MGTERGGADAAANIKPEYDRMFPSQPDINAKAGLPNCSECVGCGTQLSHLADVSAFNHRFKIETGASSEWIFVADVPPERGGGQAIVKVWCMPIHKNTLAFKWVCKKSDLAARANQFLVGQDRLLEECGLRDVTVRTWVGPVNAIEPNSGFHIWWNGLWMERARGISMNMLAYVSKKQFVEDTTLMLLNDRLDGSTVVRAAMLDLLTSQCDRHSQNVFIDESGRLTLIDNLQAMKHNWLKCGADSIFLPGTLKNEVVRFGGDIVGKRAGARRRRSVNPMIVLDYRCHVEGGRIGTSYPPQLAACLKALSDATPKAIMQRYELPVLREAEVLHSRAKDMLTKGFEWTLQRGQPVNPSPLRFRWHPPCCKLALGSDRRVACGHAWEAEPQLPFGDTVRGENWTLPGPDPGSFEGGTIFE